MHAPSQTSGNRPSPPGTVWRARLVVAAEPWLYLPPALILIALVMLVPLIIGISYAIQAISLMNPFESG